MPLHFYRSFIRSLAIIYCVSAIPAVAFAADVAPAPEAQPVTADVAPAPEAQPVVPAQPPSGWTYRFIPMYGWLVSLYGKQTVKGRTSDVNVGFVQLIEDTIGKGGTLLALTGEFEAHNGPFGFYSDAVWMKLSSNGEGVHTRAFTPDITGTLGISGGATIKMGVASAGALYEVARFTMPHDIPAAIDLIAGARYWYQQASLSFNLAPGLDVADLTIRRNLAIAKSRSVDWVDPLAGVRVRFMVAPGQDVFLRGDVGGFGVGSKFSWQATGGYSYDFAEKNGITYSGLIGFRALYVDYVQGTGKNRYGYNMLQYGPLIGVGMRF